MDDKMLKTQKDKLAGLEKQLSDLAVKQRRVEKQLADEHDAVRKCAAQRTALVAQLVDAAPEQASKVHKQLDSIDATITGSERMAESLQQLLRSIAGETAEVTGQRDRLNQLVGQEQSSRAFQQWTVELQQARADAERAFADARLKLSALDSLCARGIEQFPGAGNVAAATFEDLLIRQANLEMNGWRVSTPAFRVDSVVHIRALVPR